MTGRELYHYRIDNGLCTKCGEPVGDRNGRMCEICAKIRRSKDNERRKGFTAYQKQVNAARCQEWREKHKDYNKMRYAKMREQGLCIQCGKPNDTNKARCRECAIYQSQLYVNTMTEKKREKRREYMRQYYGKKVSAE